LESIKAKDQKISKFLKSIMVDYEKWERYDCDDAEDIKMNSEISIREITNRKDTADLIFSEATASESAVSITKSEAGSSNAASSSDKALYHRSLELYLSVIQEILRYPQLTHLYVPCQLNSVTCYMKLQKWNQSIRICDSLLDANPCILTPIQLIRCHYFRACSYFEGSKNEISLRSALTSSLAIQNLIETSTVEISEEDRSDSNLLHQKLTAFLQDQREGWKLVSEGKYLEAVKWFNDAVHSNPNSADFNDLDLLSSYFEGVGAAYDGMKDFSKVSCFM
jgi:tetratricopeptide (TPR) repeat protein